MVIALTLAGSRSNFRQSSYKEPGILEETMTNNNIKLFIIIFFAIPLIGITAFRTQPAVTAAAQSRRSRYDL